MENRVSRTKVRIALWKSKICFWIGALYMLFFWIYCADATCRQGAAQFVVFLLVGAVSLFIHVQCLMHGKSIFMIARNAAAIGTAEEFCESSAVSTLREVVHELVGKGGLSFFPEIYIMSISSKIASAFGAKFFQCGVAATEDLVRGMGRQELSAVMAHELTHLRNWDVLKAMTIGVVGLALMISIPLLLVTGFIFPPHSGTTSGPSISVLMSTGVFAAVGIRNLCSLQSEYAADAASAFIAGSSRYPIRALEILSEDEKKNPPWINVFGTIVSIMKGVLHPSIAGRIAALEDLEK